MNPDRRTWLSGLCTAALAGCGSTPAPEAPVASPMWPMPPEQPRYRFEATLRNAASLKDGSPLAEFRRLATGDEESNGGRGVQGQL